MKRFIGMAVVISFLGVQLGGCASLRSLRPDFDNKKEVGMLSGCISGVVIGGLAGNVMGALLGGMLGTVFGGITGAQLDKKTGTREEALLKHRWKDTEEQLFVEGSSVDTKHAAFGSTVQTSVKYTIIAPVQRGEIKVTETRLLFSEETGFLKVDERQFLRPQGTYLSTFRFTPPRELLGSHPMVITVISSGRQTKTIASELL